MSAARKIRRFLSRLLLVVVLILVCVFAWFTGSAWWAHWVTYPRLDRDRALLLQQYREPESFIPTKSYVGAMHSHTWWSHDSRGVLDEIIPAAKKAGLDFIFLADHAHGKLDTFPRGYNGIYDGLLIVPGTETSTGLMVNPLDSVVLDWTKDQGAIIRDIVNSGGFVGYVHTEKKHDWGNPDYQAMEIYNIHTDLLDEDGLLPFIVTNMINGNKYRHWAYRELYDDQTAILAKWDSLNRHRQIAGFSAVDAHNNQSFRARYANDGMVEWVGPNAKTISVKKPGILEKILLKEPDEAGWAYKWEMDTYFHSFNYVTNHVFSDSLDAVSLKNDIAKGHLFISFESLVPAEGFQYFSGSEPHAVNAISGDSVLVADAKYLTGISPFPAQFMLYRDGSLIDQSETAGYKYQYDLKVMPGSYRLVANIMLGGKWTPWIFTNPIYVY